MSSGLVHRRKAPLTGKPPKPLASLMPDFCSRCRAPPPAPTNTKRERTVRFSPVRRLVTLTVQDLSEFWVRLVRSEEHTSELQSLMRNSYAVFCLKKKQH